MPGMRNGNASRRDAPEPAGLCEARLTCGDGRWLTGRAIAAGYDDIEGDDTALGSPATSVASLGIVQMFLHTAH